MKKFLEELAKAGVKSYMGSQVCDSERKFDQYYAKYRQLVGKRGLYRGKSERESRVVEVIGAYPRYVLVSYKNYNMSGDVVPMNISVLYSSLISGEDSLEVE